jgi:hypothetical protein
MEIKQNKTIRDVYEGTDEFKDDQCRTYHGKNENGNLRADSYSIVNSWKNYFSQLLNVHEVNEIRQTAYSGAISN